MRAAGSARDTGHHEWAAFASHQAAEKAIKAVYQKLHMEAWGHALTTLLEHLPNEKQHNEELIEKAMVLDRHYIPTRYQMVSSAARRRIIIRARTQRSHQQCGRSLSSVKIISVDAAKVRQRVDEYARELSGDVCRSQEIIVFGSFENETYAPGSDIDLFIVLREAMIRRAIAFPDFTCQIARRAGGCLSIHPERKSLSCPESPLLAAVNKKPLAISPITLKREPTHDYSHSAFYAMLSTTDSLRDFYIWQHRCWLFCSPILHYASSIL